MAAELLKRYFHSEISPLLFPDDGFLVHSKNDDAFVNNNSVELPHAGTIPDIAVNRSSFPGTIAQRTDAATQYLLEELSADPVHLQNSEALIVAYNKRASILDQIVKELNKKGSNRALYAWAAAGASNVLTTGAARATSSPNATGTRLALTSANIVAALSVMNQQDVPLEGRHILVNADMYQDILNIDKFVDVNKIGMANIPTGMVGKIFGATVWMRSSSVVMTGTTIKAEGATGLALDNQAAVVWQEDMVRKGVGAKSIFINTGVAEYYGDILSALVRFGAIRSLNNDKGVVTISEV